MSYVGLALGIGALAVTYRSERYEIAWALLGIYAVLLVVSLGLILACGAQ